MMHERQAGPSLAAPIETRPAQAGRPSIVQARRPLRVAWHVASFNERRASLRYRCIYPMASLRQSGVDAVLFDEGAEQQVDCVVFDAWSLFPTVNGGRDEDALPTLVQRLKARGVRIVLDNCDNQFSGVLGEGWERALVRLREVAAAADVVVTCSAELAQVMQRECALTSLPYVIGDPVESRIRYTEDNVLRSLLSPGRKLSWARHLAHRARLTAERARGLTPMVWFGSHGNQFAEGGMLDLERVIPTLEKLNRERPLSLTVISNNRGKFDTHFAQQAFPCHYLEWDRVNFLATLKLHAISLIPATLNDFTRCKSANRLTLSLHHGLNVVADAIPSYVEFSSACQLDDWERGLRRYLDSPALRRQHLLEGQRLSRERCSHERIGNQWQDALSAAVDKP